jgi:hypothetical protein
MPEHVPPMDLSDEWRRLFLMDWRERRICMLVVGAITFLVNRDSPWSTALLNCAFVQFILVLAMVEMSGRRERAKKVRAIEAQHRRYQEHVDREAVHRRELEDQLELQASAGWRIDLQQELASAKAEIRRLRTWCDTLEWERDGQRELAVAEEKWGGTWREVSRERAWQAEVTRLQTTVRALEESAQVEAQKKLQGTATERRVVELEAELAQLWAAGQDEFRRREEEKESLKKAWREEAEQAVGTARQQGFREGVEAGRREATAQNGFNLRQEQTQGGSQFPVQQIVANFPLTNPQAFAAGTLPPVQGRGAPAPLPERAASTATFHPTTMPPTTVPQGADVAIAALAERNSLRVDAGSNAPPKSTPSGTKRSREMAAAPTQTPGLVVGKVGGRTTLQLPAKAMQTGNARPLTGKWAKKHRVERISSLLRASSAMKGVG